MTDRELAKRNKKVNDLVNSVETITYYKHHYIRKTGLKRRIKELLAEYDNHPMQVERNVRYPKP